MIVYIMLVCQYERHYVWPPYKLSFSLCCWVDLLLSAHNFLFSNSYHFYYPVTNFLNRTSLTVCALKDGHDLELYKIWGKSCQEWCKKLTRTSTLSQRVPRYVNQQSVLLQFTGNSRNVSAIPKAVVSIWLLLFNRSKVTAEQQPWFLSGKEFL